MNLKTSLACLTICAALTITGCSTNDNSPFKEENNNPDITAVPSNDKQNEASTLVSSFISEDDHQPVVGNADENILLETNGGIYYTNRQLAGPDLHYYDKETKKSIYLCNKPECPHDGNEFCAATNTRYIVSGRVAYNDKIFMLASENTGTQIQFKILVASLDGSQLDEFLTFYTASSAGLEVCYYYNSKNLIIHRNKIFANISLDSNHVDITQKHGFAVIDINTKEVTFLTEQPLSETNVTVQNVKCCGDYVFYSTIGTGKPAKKTLCRYDVTTGEVTTFNPQGFRGSFALLDEDRIAYIRPSSSKVSIYSLSSNTTKDYQVTYRPDSNYYPPSISNGMLLADESHLYVAYNPMLTISKYYLELQDSGTMDLQTFIASGSDLLWRFDKDLAHYTESDTAFALKDEDVNSFGKDPGNEFDYAVLSQKINRKDEVDIYDFTFFKDKVLMYEIVPNGDTDTGIIRFFTTSLDSFFSDKPEWIPYMEIEYKNGVNQMYDGSFLAF